jgi:DNA-binding protein HU-beta
VTIVGFGSFERTHRAARKGRNPKTGEEIQIEAKEVPTFKAGKTFKETVAGK